MERAAAALTIFEAHGSCEGYEDLRNFTAWTAIGVPESRLKHISADRLAPTSPEVAEEVVGLMQRVLGVDGIEEEVRAAVTGFRQMASDALASAMSVPRPAWSRISACASSPP